MVLRTRTLIKVGLLTVLACVAACHDGPTRPHEYQPYPQQLYSPSADSHFVYFRDDGAAFDRPAGIYRLPIDGTAAPEAVVSSANAYFPNVRSDGSALAYVDLYHAVIVRDLSTGVSAEALTADVVGLDWYDADTLVIDIIDVGMYALGLSSGDTAKLWGADGKFPAASPSGAVAFLRFVPDMIFVDSSLLLELHPDSPGSATRLASFADEELDYIDWSEDEAAIALGRDRRGIPRIATMEMPGQNIHDSLALYAAEPRFMPDGRIIYVHLGDKSRRERDQLWIMNRDGTGGQRIL